MSAPSNEWKVIVAFIFSFTTCASVEMMSNAYDSRTEARVLQERKVCEE